MKASAEQFSLAGDEFLGRSYEEMDCQAFIENCMKKVGISKDLAGSNAWFRAMTWTGTPEECKAKFGSIPKGALLFILKNDGGEKERGYYDGKGNASHIGLKTGRGKGAQHSSSSRGCVCESEFKDKTIPNGGWNRIGLWDRFDYGEKINALLSGQQTPQIDDDIEVVIHMYSAIVSTSNGLGANFRSRKSTNGGYIGKIPEGATVTVTADDGTWSNVTYNGKSGYVMSQYLKAVDGSGDDLVITVPRSAGEAFYNALGEALGEGGGAVE